MSPHEEEDFELVLGNRQLFFLAVVLFGVFFSIGYTVGYSRGHDSSNEVATATRQPAAPGTPRTAPPVVPAIEPAASDSAPKSTDTLYSSTPSVSVPQSRQPAELSAQPATPLARNTSATTPASSAPLVRATPTATPANSAPAGVSRGTTTSSTTSVRETTPVASRPPTAAGSSSSKTPSSAAPTLAITVPGIEPGTLYLQVLASRDGDPARKALLEIKSKGHPVTLDNHDPDWFRILVGPFTTREAADAYQLRLQAEGIKSFLRKF